MSWYTYQYVKHDISSTPDQQTEAVVLKWINVNNIGVLKGQTSTVRRMH